MIQKSYQKPLSKGVPRFQYKITSPRKSTKVMRNPKGTTAALRKNIKVPLRQHSLSACLARDGRVYRIVPQMPQISALLDLHHVVPFPALDSQMDFHP